MQEWLTKRGVASLFVMFSWCFRLPIGAHVVGAFIMPCGNCSYCSKVSTICMLLVLFSLSFIIFQSWFFLFEMPADNIRDKTCGELIWLLNWRKGHDDLCEDFFAFNRAKGTLYDGETRLFLHRDGNTCYYYRTYQTLYLYHCCFSCIKIGESTPGWSFNLS